MADAVSDELVTLEEIVAAHERIRPYVARTPLVPLGSTGVLVKAESLQPVGSFKLRGAINTMLGLGEAERARGVVAHSSGNHAIAVAHAGAALGVAVTVVMPTDAPEIKRERTAALGARIVLVGPASEERQQRAAELAAAEGLTMVEPYDSRAVVAATATIALEVLEDLPEGATPTIFVPVSGGGLAGGVAAGAKLAGSGGRVVAVEPEVAADYVASRRAGRPVALPAEQMARTAADGLRVQRVGDVPWPHLLAFVDEAVTVSEAAIASAARLLRAEAELASEPSGATSVAAALAAARGDGSPIVAVLTGANADRP
ncbi:MAG: pyridoxal-phosphate dependent enzyme [Actinobacteria bacterium]|nr:pyridoxal-phosphate dependent enzyme [Actinomycetota bacterium]